MDRASEFWPRLLKDTTDIRERSYTSHTCLALCTYIKASKGTTRKLKFLDSPERDLNNEHACKSKKPFQCDISGQLSDSEAHYP